MEMRAVCTDMAHFAAIQAVKWEKAMPGTRRCAGMAVPASHYGLAGKPGWAAG